MQTFTQAERPLAIHTPLGEDVLLLAAFRGSESLSRLYRYEVDLLAEVEADIPFERLLGAGMTVELRLSDGTSRFFNGIVKRFSQGGCDQVFTAYRAELVPRSWLLTKNIRSRIFQQMPVPDILRRVFAGLQVVYELAAQYHPRDYCVQYHESDFDFASRLMEEEGIYYFFQHSNGSHQMVVTDIAHRHPTIPGQSSIVYEETAGEVRDDMRITDWEKSQEMRSGQYTLWDYCFEMPSTRLEAHAETDESIAVGKVVHKLRVGGNDGLEIYEYPGCYAQRFDGIASHGAARPEELTNIFPDGDRTAKVRIEREQAAGLEIHGKGDCGNFLPGHKFTLERHFNGDGAYVLTSVEHEAGQSGYRSGETFSCQYDNRFTCIPADLRYRPRRQTPKPEITGVQTATVVGPEGQEIFCDKYGRIKVQFHWDREGKKDANSSCWLRVAQVWAGNRWGAFFWPRIGHEVVVAFEDGDPDRPIVIGSVYNADNMPPMVLPATRMVCGIKSASVRGKANENYNALVFVDLKGLEHLAIHSERHMVLNAEYDVSSKAGRHHGERVAGAHVVTVGRLPGSGGSGGGPGLKPGDPATSGALWGQPHPQAVLGLSSSVVYGSAFSASAPLSMQVAGLGLFKLIMDPLGFIRAFSSAGNAGQPFSEVFGSGEYGNVQVTLGTSANIVMGQSYAVNIGPAPVVLNGREFTGFQTVALVIGIIMMVLGAVFELVYAFIDNDDDRAKFVITFQIAIQVLLGTLMIAVNFHRQNFGDFLVDLCCDALFGVPSWRADTFKDGVWAVVAATILLAPAIILPPILDSDGETHLDQALAQAKAQSDATAAQESKQNAAIAADSEQDKANG